MSALWDDILNWWAGLSDRERRLLSVLGAISVLLLFWYGLAAPLNQLAKEERIHQAQASGALVEAEALSQAIAEIDQMRAGAGRPGSVADHLRSAAGSVGVGIAREQPDANGGTSAWTEPVAAKALFAWLTLLKSEYGVGVRSLEVHRSEQPGLLEVRASFAAGGA